MEHKKTVIADGEITTFHVYEANDEGCVSIEQRFLPYAEEMGRVHCRVYLSKEQVQSLRAFLNDPETARIMGWEE